MQNHKKIIIAGILLLIIAWVAYGVWMEEEAGMFISNNLGYSCLAVLTSARHRVTGECKDFPSGCIPPWYKVDFDCMENLNKRIEAQQPVLDIYRNEKYQFMVKYWPSFEIKEIKEYKQSIFSVCEGGSCQGFLYITQTPMSLSGKTLNYIKLETPASLEGMFYYYLTDIKDNPVPDIQNTFRFIEQSFNQEYDTQNEAKKSEKFYCEITTDCANYMACSEVCVNKNYKEKYPYDGPACGMPWRPFECKCVQNKCEVSFK